MQGPVVPSHSRQNHAAKDDSFGVDRSMGSAKLFLTSPTFTGHRDQV